MTLLQWHRMLDLSPQATRLANRKMFNCTSLTKSAVSGPTNGAKNLSIKICCGVPLDGASCVSAKQVSWEIPLIHEDIKAKTGRSVTYLKSLKINLRYFGHQFSSCCVFELG